MTGTAGSRTGRVRVQIVDDEPTLTEVSAADTGAVPRTSPAADGHSASRAARGRAPHAVVLDRPWERRLQGLDAGDGDSVGVLGDLVPTETAARCAARVRPPGPRPRRAGPR
ncbi:hypothetical protein ACFYO2_34975 [Streptomyces sp. NPDC006602]|uniref:hypothetical protein n=1 Tax=Streptomyces sp. NPDC006602 TaxID=3364751 RepID=UPI003697CE6F